jgi:mannan endo-1,4-beta-mannosidase
MSGDRVVDRLRGLSGSRVLAGQHNRQPLGTPSLWFDRAAEMTGHLPAVWGQDLDFEAAELHARTSMVDEAIRQWEAGRLVTPSWHALRAERISGSVSPTKVKHGRATAPLRLLQLVALT